jgi:hypothetical protein
MVPFRKPTLLPLHDCLYAWQATRPHLTRSASPRGLQRPGNSRLPDTAGDKPTNKTFTPYPIGYCHTDLAEVHTEEGQLYRFVAIDRACTYAYANDLQRPARQGWRRSCATGSPPCPTRSTPS